MTQTSTTFLELLISSITVLIATVLLFFYKKDKINIIQLLLWSFSFQAYNISFIGPTITPFFLVVFLIYLKKISFNFKEYFHSIYPLKVYLLIFLPTISSIIAFFLYIFGNSSLINPKSDLYFIIRPLIFYFKNFLPLFIISKAIHDSPTSYDDAFREIKKIAIFSSYYAIFQLIVYVTTNDVFLIELMGGKKRYLGELPNGISFIRINAFFIEPKHLAAFLAMSIPLFLNDKNYKKAFICLVAGLLTVSQTFVLLILIGIIVFGILNKVNNIRLKVLASIGLVFVFFYSISLFKEIIFDSTIDSKETIAFSIFMKRALDRYDTSIYEDDAELLGMPIQKDLEFPVVQFIKDYPYLFFTGYGIGNSNFIPPKYFYGQWNYDAHLEGTLPNHMNFRWFFYVSEFGIFTFIFYFIFFTNVLGNTYGNKYYSFIIVTLFFNEMEIFLIMFYQFLTRDK